MRRRREREQGQQGEAGRVEVCALRGDAGAGASVGPALMQGGLVLGRGGEEEE